MLYDIFLLNLYSYPSLSLLDKANVFVTRVIVNLDDPKIVLTIKTSPTFKSLELSITSSRLRQGMKSEKTSTRKSAVNMLYCLNYLTYKTLSLHNNLQQKWKTTSETPVF